jgi:branched-chain amino acid transport system substrate-binding protein
MRAARTWAAALVVVLALTLAAVAGTAGAGTRGADTTAAAAPIKIGIVYSRTGLLSAYGAQYRQGLTLGLQYVTKGTNRINGRPVQVTYVDDAGDPAKAVTAARDLIGQGYKIIAGSTSSGAAVQVAPLAAQNRVLFISGPAASDAITGLNRYTFRAGRQSTQDVLASKGILGNSTGRRVVVFAQDSVFGQGNVAAVRAILGGAGHTVSSILVPLSAQDFTPFAQRANQANPDLLFVAWAGTTAPAMWRALEQQGTIRGTTVATGLAERATWGSYVPGLNFLSHYVAEAPKNKVNTWLKLRMKRANQVPDIFTPDGFVTAQMIQRAVSRGGDDVDRMISALEGWQFRAPKGTQRIRQSDHAMLQPMFQVRTRQVNGKWRAVPVKTFPAGNMAPAPKQFP